MSPSATSHGAAAPLTFQPTSRTQRDVRSPLRWNRSPRTSLAQGSLGDTSQLGLADVATPRWAIVLHEEEPAAAPLLSKGLLSSMPEPSRSDPDVVPDDLAHVRALFSTQLPGVPVLGVFRVENSALSRVYDAVRGTMGDSQALELWHGTTPDCLRNIVLNGFNRAYSGRHGTRLGHGTYFSTEAEYSLRFCGRRAGARRVMLLARVLVGACAKGSPDLVEPPYRDSEQMTRYDATVDDISSPSMFCIFRDYQALPCYVVEFSAPA